MKISPTTTQRSLRTLCAATICAAALATGCSHARAAGWVPTVGIADNGEAMFSDPSYLALKTRITRKIVPYDFYQHKDERESFDEWVSAAAKTGVEPLIAFNHSDRYPTKLPSVASYRKTVTYLHKNYPRIKTISVWNEANHRSQPTAYAPMRAAQYYNAARLICRGCKIVAADVLDQKNMIPWVTTFKRYAYKPKIWGLHSYVDANHNIPWAKSATRSLLSFVTGEVWLTEVGGLVAFSTTYAYNEMRAAQGVKYTLRMGRRDPRIKRIYLYSWYGTYLAKKRKPYAWDSGLVSWDGKTRRPGYYTLRIWLNAYPASLKIR
ncbi:MAG: glycosyl hydrolase [Solirubrobacterales bacterium]